MTGKLMDTLPPNHSSGLPEISFLAVAMLKLKCLGGALSPIHICKTGEN